MITAHAFAHKHNSFWKTYFPALENYVRVINSGAYERDEPEIKWEVSSDRNYLVAEVAYVLSNKPNANSESVDAALNEAKHRLSDLPGIPAEITELDAIETATAIKLSRRLRTTLLSFLGTDTTFVYSPTFSGCGAISRSKGDYIVGQTLIEVKSVERGFRATDFRQLLTYYFLNSVKGEYPIDEITLVNPRKGISFSEQVGRFVYDTSGADVLEVQTRFLSAIGMGGISR